MKKEKISYLLVRIATFPLSFLPYRAIHLLGRGVGLIAYCLLKKYRKRTLSNIALARDLSLSPKEIVRYAKESFQNLSINLLEYAKFAREKDFSRIIQCENPQIADQIHQKGKGIIFFCGHQANFETLFLDGTLRMKGVAIGRPIKNKTLYNWITKMREINGGKMIQPKNALKEGIKALREGKFLGIVGDQGMPDADYSFPFLGRRAWNTTAPALLAYKTETPIIVATLRREKNRYFIHYSDPLYPNKNAPKEEEIKRMMNLSLSILDKSIKKNMGQYLWQHNRYKQQNPRHIPKKLRHESIAIFLPKDKNRFHYLLSHLETFRKIYFLDFLFLYVPEEFRSYDLSSIEAEKVYYYSDEKELFKKDYRFKIVYNLTSNIKLNKHYKKLSAFFTLGFQDLLHLAEKNGPIKEKKKLLEDPKRIFTQAILRADSPIHEIILSSKKVSSDNR